MNGAQWVVHALRTQGVDTVFGYPGGAIMPVYDALYDGGVEHLLCRHEQGAAMAAIGLFLILICRCRRIRRCRCR
ncbi:hypothetical protein CWN54_25170, partial [Klebsiella pneumoniae]